MNLSLDQIRTVGQVHAFVEGADLAESPTATATSPTPSSPRALDQVFYPRLDNEDETTSMKPAR